MGLLNDSSAIDKAVDVEGSLSFRNVSNCAGPSSNGQAFLQRRFRFEERSYFQPSLEKQGLTFDIPRLCPVQGCTAPRHNPLVTKRVDRKAQMCPPITHV